MNIVQTIISELPEFGQGIIVALEVLAGLLAVGLILGLALAVLEVFGNRYVRFVAINIRKLLWAVPQMVLLFLVFYLPFNMPALLAAIIALGLCSAAFQAQIFRGAITSIAPGQLEAARAMGLSQSKILVHVIVPQMAILAIGPWTNEFASELKDTSLAYVVGVVEIMRQAKYIIAYTFGNSLVVYGFVAIIYFVLTRLGTMMLYQLEKKLWVPGFERRNA